MKVRKENLSDLSNLIFRSGWAVRMVNLITLYRIIAAPLLLYLAFSNQFEIFKWLLAASFFTDLIDGQLARKYKATSVLGAKLDSIGDDLTVLAGVIGLFVARPEFIREQAIYFVILFTLFLIQLFYALVRYGKITSFHTYLAKLAALLQGIFLCGSFFFETPWYTLFYITFITIALELIEETIMVYLLPQWKNDVHGIYWALRLKNAPPVH
jgi:cardiolipin synthase